ncbi:hypothetical protein [Granulicella sp. L46]|uniref:hypothetical protein n=1 Tax=Granulicella sp. L46 TaxID=1641865 RepID=UPI00131B4B52|nr:hypothetical protein [Granulicella sp. L46]
MLKDGSYVRLVLSPQAGRGTIHDEINHSGEQQFLFRSDPRFSEQVEMFIYDGDAEECARPDDAEILAINALLAQNPPPLA